MGGAPGMELMRGYHVSLHGHRNLTFAMLAIIEEISEMAGVLFFICALMPSTSAHNISEVKIYLGDHQQRMPEWYSAWRSVSGTSANPDEPEFMPAAGATGKAIGARSRNPSHISWPAGECYVLSRRP